jgi:retron-type reverse transcriptase
MPGFLDDLRAQLKTGTFTPLPVRERTIPKPGGSGKSAGWGYRPSRTGSSRRR